MSKDLVPSHLLVPAGTGSLDSYIQEVNKIPVLTLEEEQEYARLYRDKDEIEAARRMVLAHLRFVVHVAKGYTGYGLALGDLIQEGNIGLMKAVKRFDPDHGVRLVSFAVHWIRAEIHEYILRNWRMVKVATTKAQRKLFFNLRKFKKNLSWLSQDETEAVARDLGVAPAEVTEMEKRMYGHDLAYDAPTQDDDDTYSPSAYLPSPDADPADLVANSEIADSAGERLAAALRTLDDRSRDIMQRRWLSEPKVTLQDLADEYQVSAERIRQIEANAIKKLRVQVAI